MKKRSHASSQYNKRLSHNRFVFAMTLIGLLIYLRMTYIQDGANEHLMSHLATQLGYSAGEFQALQLIVLAAFGVVD